MGHLGEACSGAALYDIRRWGVGSLGRRRDDGHWTMLDDLSPNPSATHDSSAEETHSPDDGVKADDRKGCGHSLPGLC